VKTFNELDLSEPVYRAVAELGFETPSPIQAQALPLLLAGPTDFIGLAATGTGKTAAFGIPLLEQIDPKKKVTQYLILCPTRELALQVAGQIDLLGKYLGVRALPIYGGSGYDEQIRGLRDGVPIVVGTPGRLIDHLERGNLKLDNIKTLILDEADEMISMGFKDELEKILESVNRKTSHIWLFSATMGSDVRRVASHYLSDPKQVQVNRVEMLSNTVQQIFYPTRESDKAEVLCKVIENADDFYGLIFCQTKSLVSDLTTFLTSRGYKVDSLHGDKDQRSRERTMQAFRDKKVRMLICTDVASRGLDVKDVTHVINYSIPRELDNYVHRIGRTARGGKAGIAISLVTPSHRGLIRRIENLTKSKIEEGRVPSRRDIGTKKISRVLTQFMDQQFQKRAMDLMGDDWNAAILDMPKNEIVGRFLALISPEVFEDREKLKANLGPMKGAINPGSRRADRSQDRSQERRGRGRRDSDNRVRSRKPAGRGGKPSDRFDSSKERRAPSETSVRKPERREEPKKKDGFKMKKFAKRDVQGLSPFSRKKKSGSQKQTNA